MILSTVTLTYRAYFSEITYQSQSPDETALVETARNNGFVFVRRKADEIVIKERGWCSVPLGKEVIC